MKQLFCLFLVFSTSLVSCQEIDPLVSSIAKENIVECETVGITGSQSSLYNKFIKLKRRASKEKLIELINHDSLAIVGYSSYAILDRKLIEPSNLLSRFIDDEKSVTTFCGCLMDKETVSSLIYNRYWNSRIEYPNKDDYENYVVNDSRELQKMDSLVLYSHNPDKLLLWKAFANRVYSKGYKGIILEWALEKQDFSAMEYVFKYLRSGNKEKLLKSFDTYISSEENHKAQKDEIVQMRSILIGKTKQDR